MANSEQVGGLSLRLRQFLGKSLYIFETNFAKITGRHDWLLRRNFNRWARWGFGEQMERDHAAITDSMLARLRFGKDEVILDVGCGDGWTVRRVLSVAGNTARVVGVDISNEMVNLARQHSAGIPNVEFKVASAEKLPFEANRFSKIVSVEAFYFCKDQRRVLKELLRITKPGGDLALLMCVFKGHPDVEEWKSELRVPVHVLNGDEYKKMLGEEGWTSTDAEIFAPPSVTPERGISHGMALLVTGKKPLTA